MTYRPQTFDIPELDGISKQTIEEHLKLYEGYVKHVNEIHDKIASFKDGAGDVPYELKEMNRRLGFEWGGMRNHEYYFSQFEGGAKEVPDGKLKDLLEKQYGSVAAFGEEHFKAVATTRGVGWAMLYHDTKNDRLVTAWVDEQHVGQLVDMPIILALDMWEHSYMLDYPPSKKKEYIDAFGRNLNWEVISKRVK